MRLSSPQPSAAPASAFTLTEVLIAAAISAVALAVVITAFTFMYRSFAGMGNYTDMNRQSRAALDTMTRDIRQAGALVSGSSTSLVFTNINGTLLQYTYNPSAQTLTYTNGSTGNGGTLLKNCASCSFAMFQHDPVPGTTMVFTNTTTASNCKVIVLNWKCSKSDVFSLNTELVQTAKIVLRN